ncbi:hypothetical protein FEM48_Zijuj10G0056500 [Ziziphus jujuba var. spinosa]|uniref:Fe-S metabolism associated domain-containing protein n=1 Tax=Ziziphus jujuba var. spinosa TaxID=714518 RepID=A0A978ULL9_ZIZJJ|nr:hypothetical protein FEM48_Zijuj10G0056500 [Ziziphus jujuba var. spinosa]
MNSSSTITTSTHFHSSSSCTKILRKRYDNYETRHSALKFNAENEKNKFLILSLKSIKNYGFSPKSPSKLHARNPSLPAAVEFERPLETDGLVVADKLQLLVLEFKSLNEPLDRVKRLLHYAAILPPYDESARVAENRVVGCATQVWLEVEMDDLGRMRFRADSDSEISKGFCSCLIWMLDGAKPEEVSEMRAEDLEHVNVGLYVKANSRVNTWQNVLISMQKRTKALVMERGGKNPPLLEPLPSLIVNHGSSAEAQGFLFPTRLVLPELQTFDERQFSNEGYLLRA